jgi:hypothetical protein
MADDSISEEVVIDSKDALNYETWQTNLYGQGAKVNKRLRPQSLASRS